MKTILLAALLVATASAHAGGFTRTGTIAEVPDSNGGTYEFTNTRCDASLKLGDGWLIADTAPGARMGNVGCWHPQGGAIVVKWMGGDKPMLFQKTAVPVMPQ